MKSPFNQLTARSPIDKLYKVKLQPLQIRDHGATVRVRKRDCFFSQWPLYIHGWGFVLIMYEIHRTGEHYDSLSAKNAHITGDHMIDKMTTVLMMINNGITVAFNLWILYTVQDSFNAFLSLYPKMPFNISEATYDEYLACIRIVLVLWQILAVICGIANCLFGHLSFQVAGMEPTPALLTGVVLLAFQQWYFAYSGPVMANDTIVLTIFTHMTLTVEHFCETIESKSRLKTKAGSDMSGVLRSGTVLGELMGSADSVLGTNITVNVLTSFIGSFIAYFKGLSKVFHPQPFHPINLFDCAFALVYSLLYALRGFSFLHGGQGVENALSRAKEALEDVIMDKYDSIDSNQLGSLEILLRKLSGDAHFKPLGYFSLNHASALSVTASVIGYSIILLQFKQAGF